MIRGAKQPLTNNLNTLQKHRDITIGRLEKFIQRGEFDDVNLNTVLWKKRSGKAVVLEVFPVPDRKRISFEEAMKGEYKPTNVGEWFGPSFSTFWFKVSIEIPADFEGHQVLFEFDSGTELMIWSTDGVPITGLTGGDNDEDRHVDYLLAENAVAGQKFELCLEMACNGRNGINNTDIPEPDMNKYWQLRMADISVRNKLAQELLMYFKLLLQLVKDTPQEWQINSDALYCGDSIMNAFRLDDDEEEHEGFEMALAEAHGIAVKFFADHQKGGRSLHQIYAIGHCHIDTAWLWPYDETKRKSGRSWARQITFMKRNPNFKFTASQAQQYEWVEQKYPTLFKDMQEFEKKGQFLPVGGTWVEMDCNLTSGESLVRQFLYGQRYFESRFGKRCTVFWLPDTFGYSSQLPQLATSAGMKYFLTQKISWNNINKFPNNTFKWAGLDNTEVLSHFPPADTYSGQCTVGEVLKNVHNHRDKAYSNKSLYLFGNGDGGGGPLYPMIERLEVLGNLEGLPATIQTAGPAEFFKDLEETSRDLVRWKGELYLEFHRGTYTSHGLVKKFNRKSEILLREVEFLSTLVLTNPHKKNSDFTYPASELNRLWKLVLVNQFHDVLPGTSLKLVYDEVMDFYRDVEASGHKLKNDALRALFDTGNLTSNSGLKQAIAVINTTSWPIDATVVELNMSELTPGVELYGSSTWRQCSKDGRALVYVNDLQSGSLQSFALGNKPSEFVPVIVQRIILPSNSSKQTDSDDFIHVTEETGFEIENKFINAKFDQHGRLVSLYDRESQHESIIPDQLGNVFKLFEDIPTGWDAWDIEVFHLQKGWDAKVGLATVEEAGPLRVILKVKHPLTKRSSLEQRIIITAADGMIEFDTKVDWHENRLCLKVEFPLNVNCDFATYETQFGYIQRPTHYNTSWDLARFEVCGHRYADLSEYGFGVALFNDCKYGYSTLGGIMRMSLLRSPKGPDGTTDMEIHNFRYALYPHKGSFLASDVVKKAYQYNEKPIVHPIMINSSLLFNTEFFRVSESNFVLDTVKVAEDPRGSNQNENVDIVLRFYESYGGRGVARVETLFNIKEARFCNILEDLEDHVTIEDNGKTLVIPFGPFKVVSVRLLAVR
ncbi:hypothetical protein BCR33DRAFT_722459 [Rhizoclosmatium globosum]|uniref:Alpha-mannosidase n=1 Tax=Rhizoclosmatium globosum TaxID=329046 RepID=A0A1Y2BMI3_9FUNG|nr:hypothetical protein BCR33DRAFT_722459 [Rhizoclosmatium globosum]|eukprot:ORY35984.1 hypothetical protein BCR33DRAFT_722459 [Rhizoclosmatium globosum]